ncbi:ATPase family associated with various cellular activities (AAA) [Cellulosimicrobium cellulans]|nr:ATPase family associated with various cellular activities (AAA) [Cellulosimicrobium cellulans]
MDTRADQLVVEEKDLVQLVQMTAAGNAAGSHALLRRMARRYRSSTPALSRAIVETLRQGPLRAAGSGLALDQPVDSDSRLPLIREESPVVLSNEPILPAALRSALAQVVEEHRQRERLLEAGLAPTRTALLVGAPGVGKTLAARWMAREVGLPMLTLDLSSVMSSFLGRTGANVRRVLDYARSTPSVLLLDELDAVAKRRDDATEIGELKRLVTVLLQEIDSWPEGALLLAATNHAELLDPAVWRRFELVVEFPTPDEEALMRGAAAFLDDPDADEGMLRVIAHLYSGDTLSSLERDVMRARRTAALREESEFGTLMELARARFAQIPQTDRGPAAASLLTHSELSQRAVSELTGVSRDTIRKYARKTAEGDDSVD